MMSSNHSSSVKAQPKSTGVDEKPTQNGSAYRQCILQMSSGSATFEFSPAKFKDYLVEYFGMVDTIGAVNDNDYVSTLLSLSSMDDLNPEGFHQSSLSSTLYAGVKQEARILMLKKVLHLLLTDKPGHAMRAAVEALLDDDLKERRLNFNPKDCEGHQPIVVKARMIVRDMAWSTMTRKPVQTPANEFKIELCMLINGQGGNIRRMILIFRYNEPVENFLNILRDATILCDKQSGVCGASSRGYTLKDGPWTYQLANEGRYSESGTANKPSIQNGNPPWYEIQDHWTYKDMLVRLKNSGGCALVWHSIEKAIQVRHEQVKEEERKDLDAMYAVLDENGQPFFDQGTYMEYLENALAHGEDC